MPGCVGLIQADLDQDLTKMFDKIMAPMDRGGRLRTERRVDSAGQWGLGRVHLGVFQKEPQLDRESVIQVLVHGELFNEAKLDSEIGHGELRGMARGTAPLLRRLYEVHGQQCFSRLEGAFSAVILDSKAKKVILATDFLGSYPLYWFHGPRRLVFASELKSVLADPAVQRGLDPQAIADFLTFGLLFGDKTLSPSVRLLPPASTLTYWWEEDRCQLESYGAVESLFQPWEGTKAEYIDTVVEAFNRAVGRGFSGDYRFGLSLSGGLDSRAILSGVYGTSVCPSTYTLGVKGCADEVIAQTLSKLAGTQHVFSAMDTEYLGEFLPNIRQMVGLTDGMYLTHGVTEILARQIIEGQGYSVLLRGHGAELAKMSLAWPLHTDATIFNMQRKDEFIPYMLKRANYISPELSWGDLFTDRWAIDMQEAARCSLETSLAHLTLAPPDLCSYLYLMEHHRRFTVPSLELFRDIVEVRLPFVDVEFLRALWHGPAQWRDGTEIHRAIIKRNHPELLRVRNSNTGAPADAGPFVECVLDKFNTIFKRLNLHGFRHYHNYESWMKRQLNTAVEDVLLQPDSLARGIYREKALRYLLDETRQGRMNYGYLFQVLLILELWQQDNT